MSTLFQQVASWGHPRLLVLGDLMLDRYTWCEAERVSPEAPVLVLRAETEEIRLGGAASVAAILRGLEAEVSLAGVTGADANGRMLRALLHDDAIDDSLVLCEADRRTTTKERFLARSASSSNQQILRVDSEHRHSISAESEQRLIEAISARLPEFAAVLISDYAKGVCTPALVQHIISAAREQRKPVLVDPGRDVDFERYRGATVVKPNRLEAQDAMGIAIHSPADALPVGAKLCTRFDLDAVLVTLDRDGIVVCRADGCVEVHPTSVHQVCDITGAGDTVLATAGIGLAEGMPFDEIAQLANFCAGMQVERSGVAVISRRELLATGDRESFSAMGNRFQSIDISSSAAEKDSRPVHRPNLKQLTLDELARLAKDHRRRGETVVFTNGCFDLLHIGHVSFLQEAAQLGDVLIVAINSDQSVRRLKGTGRPVIHQNDRLATLAALACVDHVLNFNDDTPHELLRAIRPDVLVKGGTTSEVVGREVVEAYGGRVLVVGQVADISTTQLVSRIKESSCT